LPGYLRCPLAFALHIVGGMKTILATTLLLATASLTACATDDGATGTEMDIEITSKGGKSDAVDGKRLRTRIGVAISPWYNYEDAEQEELSNLARAKSVKIDAATSSSVVVSGNMFTFPASASDAAVEASPWFGDKILRLSVEAAPGAKTADVLGFVLTDTVVEPLTMISCVRGAVSSNFFRSVDIDLVARELHVDDTHTFSFAECGIAPDGTAMLDTTNAEVRVWNFGTFVVPLETTGSLKGTYNYKMKAELL
jgi:uncharacterized protein YaiE (UPF0345 family)